MHIPKKIPKERAMTDKIEFKIIDNTAIEAFIDNKKAGEVTFIPTDNTMIIDSTAVADGYQDEGIGTQLIKQVASLAKKLNKKIIPVCPFARAVFDKNPELNNVRQMNAAE